MEWFINNWYIFIAMIAIICVVVVYITKWYQSSSDNKLSNLKEWLRYAVFKAEKKLGSGTGQLKLRMVYDMAIQKFPWVAQVVSFDNFSDWVDDALNWMKKELEKNPKMVEYIEDPTRE